MSEIFSFLSFYFRGIPLGVNQVGSSKNQAIRYIKGGMYTVLKHYGFDNSSSESY